MSYITAMGLPAGVIMAADRQITQHAHLPEIKLEGRNDYERFILNAVNKACEKAFSMLRRHEKPLSRTVRKLFAIGGDTGVNMGQAMPADKKTPASLFLDYFCRNNIFDKPETAAKELCAYLHGIDGGMDTVLMLAGYDKTGPAVLTPEIYRISIKNNGVKPVCNYAFHYAGYNDYFKQYCQRINDNIFNYSLQDAADICNFAIAMRRALGKRLDFSSGVSEGIETIAVTRSGIQWVKKAGLAI